MFAALFGSRQTPLTPEQQFVLEQHRLEAEKREREKSYLNMSKALKDGFYDVVISTNPFMDITGREGWTIGLPQPTRGSNPANSTIQTQSVSAKFAKMDGPIVAVVGQFNKGKTTVLNGLVELQDAKALPAGNNIHTEGLSVKCVMYRERSMVVVDTVGGNSPICSMNEDMCQQHKASECFVRDVAFKMADVFIVVVNEIGYNEQEGIAALALTLKNRKNDRTGKVLVIHNLRDVSQVDEFVLKKTEITKLFDGCRLVSEAIEYHGKSEKIEFLDGFESDKPGNFQYQQHFVLGKNGTPAGAQNSSVMVKIMNAICSVQLYHRDYDLKQRLENAFNETLPNYLNPAPAKVRIELDGSLPNVRLVNIEGAAGPSSSEGQGEEQSPNGKGPMLPKYTLKTSAERVSRGVDVSPIHILTNKTEYVVVILMPGVVATPDVNYEKTDGCNIFTVEGVHQCPVNENEYTSVDKHNVVYGSMRVQFSLPADTTNSEPEQTDWCNGRLELVFKKADKKKGKIIIAARENAK